MKRVALNGFGRIGKNFLRAYLQDTHAHAQYELVAINIGPADINAVAYMVMYDSLLGTYAGNVSVQGTTLLADNFKIQLLQETDAAQLPWTDLTIDIVVDATGHYTHAQDAKQHIQAGAKKVVITAPAHGHDITVVMGVNDRDYKTEKHQIISLGSCTTNALVPLLHVMKTHTQFVEIFASTVHAYTNTQELLDVDAQGKDLRKSRAAGLNIIPSTTGAAISVAEVLPELKNTLCANALRVPTPIVSLADITLLLEKSVTVDDINSWFANAAQGPLKSILSVAHAPLVSGDFKGNSHSVIYDATMTMVSGTLVRIYGWYDNEWGYSNRINDFLKIC
ncbi:MAG: glyceraldehyde-3-phosphate dehydrogenase [Candidatus Babeliaceae bacterium]|nr:glyceraldehyde-3-phosphate dehydrogenase [Candidatus Babeliaceae bacterium]